MKSKGIDIVCHWCGSKIPTHTMPYNGVTWPICTPCALGRIPSIKEIEQENTEESIIVSKKEYKELLRSEQKLNALEAAGVDNWQGYDDAMDILREEGYFKKEEDE